jgi:DNA-binding MarR family transcriptional regulator
MGLKNTSEIVMDDQRRSQKVRSESPGVRKAVIALLLDLHNKGRHGTIAEVLVALEVIDSHLDGRPHSMKSLAEKLNIPYTSVSRIVYSLSSDASPGGILKLVPDTKDRRRKHIDVNFDVLRNSGTYGSILDKIVPDYYGNGAAVPLREAAES